MKILLISLQMILLLGILNGKARIFSNNAGKDITLDELGRELMAYDVIFFGEEHGNPTLHQLQRELLPCLQKTGQSLILSFEMWERDTQSVLDAFLASEITEDDFVKRSRVWNNYPSDYRPLIMFAKEQQLQTIAANVPQVYAAMVARGGWDFIHDLPLEQRKMIATRLNAPDDAYRASFYETMNRMGGHVFDKTILENYYKAQCMKDETMAESIYMALQEHPDARVLHFNGTFHSQDFLGTVARLQTLAPELKIAVISPMPHDDWRELMPDQNQIKAGTHLILLPKDNDGEQQ